LIEFANENCTNYFKRTRVYGEGDIRIGKFISLNDDIYSIGFISQLKDEIMVKHFDILAGELIEEVEDKQNKVEEGKEIVKPPSPKQNNDSD